MLYEYAVEPQAVGESWETFRYVIEKFGFDRGRLISKFPRNRFDEVLIAVKDFRPVEKLRVIEALNIAKQNKVVGCSRPYDLARVWLHNALKQRPVVPFRAVISKENPGAEECVLLVRELDELNPLMKAPHDIKGWRISGLLRGGLTKTGRERESRRLGGWAVENRTGDRSLRGVILARDS
jgi:hypothetical protein